MHTHTTDTASKELKAQRDLVRRPHKRIAALALAAGLTVALTCLLYTSPSPRDA